MVVSMESAEVSMPEDKVESWFDLPAGATWLPVGHKIGRLRAELQRHGATWHVDLGQAKDVLGVHQL